MQANDNGANSDDSASFQALLSLLYQQYERVAAERKDLAVQVAALTSERLTCELPSTQMSLRPALLAEETAPALDEDTPPATEGVPMTLSKISDDLPTHNNHSLRAHMEAAEMVRRLSLRHADDTAGLRSEATISNTSPGSVTRKKMVRRNTSVHRVIREVSCCPMIHPDRSPFLQTRDVIMVVLLVFVAFVSPVQVSIVGVDETPGMLIASSMVDACFFIDLIIEFFTMRQVKTDYGFRWVTRGPDVAVLYMKTWFTVDVISVLPFDRFVELVADYSNFDSPSTRIKTITKILRLLKLTRLFRVSRVTHRLEQRLSMKQGRLQLIKFVGGMTLVIHWLACLWCFTLVLHESAPQWTEALPELERDMTKTTPWRLYFTALYFTAYTITSVGYGDISPRNILERLVCTIMLLVSGVTWAVFLGEVCTISANLTQDDRDWRQCMDDLTTMVQDRIITRDMRGRMRSFLMSNRAVVKAAQGRGRRQTLMSYMSPGLKGEVSLELNRAWIAKVSFLKRLLPTDDDPGSLDTSFRAFVVDVSERISTEVYAQSEPFGRPQALYIVRRGLVSGYGRVWSVGAVLGADFVLSNAVLIDEIRGTALTYAEVNVLRRADFMQAVETHSVVFPRLAPQVRRYVCWTAFQRAVLRRAKQPPFEGSMITATRTAYWD